MSWCHRPTAVLHLKWDDPLLSVSPLLSPGLLHFPQDGLEDGCGDGAGWRGPAQ